MFQRKSEVIGIALPRRLADRVAPKVRCACALSVEQDCSLASCNREPLTRLRDHAKIKTQEDFRNYRMAMVCIARRYAQNAPTSERLTFLWLAVDVTYDHESIRQGQSLIYNSAGVSPHEFSS